MIYENFRNGINIGGWLSQYDCLTLPPQNKEEMKTHLSTFITEQDIARIASLKLDHIRMPVDYRVLEAEEDSLTDEKTAFFYMDKCVEWCAKYHLNLIIDLHHAAGNLYGRMDAPMPLLAEEALRLRFIRLWEKLTRHFKGCNGPVIMFELLNEVADGSGYLWNSLYQQTVQAIHEIDSKRYILIGSNEQNSAFRLKELELLEDDRVFYNFHFYEPIVFTHQRAHFSEELKAFNRKIHYPDDISGFTDFLLQNRKYIKQYIHSALEAEVSRETMLVLLKDALDFVTYSGKELYCGEFGVINTADANDAANWMNDFICILEEHHIGHAMWNYKELDFGLVNINNEVVSKERLEKLFGVKAV